MGLVSRLADRARGGMHALARELLKFGVVGAVAFVVDVTTFNLLRYGLDGVGPLEERPLTAKALSVAVATLTAWVGNRYWTFRLRRRASARRELLLFVAMNAGAMVIALSCLAFSHYVLGLRSPLADNVSANVVGLVLGTAFRFWAYSTFVFTEPRDEPDAQVPLPLDVPAAAAELSR